MMRDDLLTYAEPGETVEQIVQPRITPSKNRRKRELITAELVEAMCRGDHPAFQKVYLHSIGPLTDFLNMLLRSRSETEEVAQEIFTYIWANRQKIDAAKNFKGYLFTVAKTMAFKQMARKKLDEKYYNYKLHTLPEFNSSPDDVVITQELALLIRIYLDNMPAQRRKVFEMSRFEGKSDAEIAKELNLSINTVRTHLKLALKGFRKLLSLSLLLFFS